MSKFSTLAAELAELQAKHDPVNAEIQEATSDSLHLKMLESESSRLMPMIRGVVHALARSAPESLRDALALAIVSLDYAAIDQEEGGADGSGSELAAARGLVVYLAQLAGIGPASMNLFRPILAEQGIASETQPSRIEAMVAEMAPLWQRHNALDESCVRPGGMPPTQRAQKREEMDAISDRLSAQCVAIFRSKPVTMTDALCLSVLIRHVSSPITEAEQTAREEAQVNLIKFLSEIVGRSPAELGLEVYWKPRCHMGAATECVVTR